MRRVIEAALGLGVLFGALVAPATVPPGPIR